MISVRLLNVKLCILVLSMSYAYAKNPLLDYLEDMQAKKLPATIIVGCGHSQEKDVLDPYFAEDGCHLHPNCWCVNKIENVNSQIAMRDIKADDYLDITRKIPNDSYHGAFDTVVLERVRAVTLNHSDTLMNAVQMLKVGGTLLVDHFNSIVDELSYSYPAYSNWLSTNPAFTFEDQGTTMLKRYGIERNCIEVEEKLLGMANFLTTWSMADVLPIKGVPQIYTKIPGSGKSLQSARITSILFATKTDATNKAMLNNPLKEQEKQMTSIAIANNEQLYNDLYGNIIRKEYTPFTEESALEMIKQIHIENENRKKKQAIEREQLAEKNKAQKAKERAKQKQLNKFFL